jgi:type II secretory pathway pseudopilin PulG
MSARYLKLLLLRLNNTRSKQKRAGFTITELLISILLGGLIIVSLLSLVIELLETDNREIARTETQREMQMAIDYISTDIREAVYVYDGKCLAGEDYRINNQTIQSNCAGLFADGNYIDNPNNSVPILAFWKLEPLPETLQEACANSEQPEVEDELVPCLAGRTYSLIVYYLSTDNPNPDNTWQGKARILRYELSKYTSDGQPVDGYADPTQETNFSRWPLDTTQQNGADPAPPVALVDFVDDRSMDDINELDSDSGAASVECPEQYTLTPDDDTLDSFGFSGMRNFYACVRIPEEALALQNDEDEATSAFNQKVILFLRGNALGKAGIDSYNEGFLPAIATQVLNRGVRNKLPSQ